MPTFLLSIFRNPWAVGALSVILVGGLQQARVMWAQADADSARTELAEQRQEWAEATAAGEKAARRAVEAAVEAERARQAERIAQEREAAQRLAAAAREAQARADDWQRRYREAVREDASCRAWAEQKVACPLP